jgi:hypothetical protein
MFVLELEVITYVSLIVDQSIERRTVNPEVTCLRQERDVIDG